MGDVAPDDIQWAIDVAARAASVNGAMILPHFRHLPLPEVRRGMYWFFRETLHWSFPRIGRAMERNHGTVVHACKGELLPGSTAFIVFRALQKAWAERCASEDRDVIEAVRRAASRDQKAREERERKQEQAARAQESAALRERATRRVATVGSVIRVCPPDRHGVAIEWWHGRFMPTKRMSREEAGALVFDQPTYFRVAALPTWLGCCGLLPISEAEWLETTQGMEIAA